MAPKTHNAPRTQPPAPWRSRLRTCPGRPLASVYMKEVAVCRTVNDYKETSEVGCSLGNQRQDMGELYKGRQHSNGGQGRGAY